MSDNSLSINSLETLANIGKSLTSSLNSDDIFNNVLQNISELIDPCGWALSLPSTDTKYTYKRVVNLPDIQKGVDYPEKDGLWSILSDHKEGLFWTLDNPQLSSHYLEPERLKHRHGFSLIAAPLIYNDKLHGVLELWRHQSSKGPFTLTNLQVLKIVSDFAAIALENALNFHRVEELTLKDDLTSLVNFRHLQDLLDIEVKRSTRYHKDLSMIFIDLDKFKSVNDVHGHLFGSELLKEFASLLSTLIRNVDVACRYGGDEFVVMLPETPKEHAVMLANRIREKVEQHVFLQSKGKEISLTASFGVATFPIDAQNAQELLSLSDKAMYQAKNKSRNCVVSLGSDS